MCLLTETLLNQMANHAANTAKQSYLDSIVKFYPTHPTRGRGDLWYWELGRANNLAREVYYSIIN